jgi:hypothetical protein
LRSDCLTSKAGKVSELKIDELLGFGGPEDYGQQNKNSRQQGFDEDRPSFILPVEELTFVESIEQQYQPY